MSIVNIESTHLLTLYTHSNLCAMPGSVIRNYFLEVFSIVVTLL